jgi:hypothetical protein
LIQFFQLLGEGHNKLFHNLIVRGKKDININNKINFNVINNEKEKEKEKEIDKDKDKESNIEKNSNLIKQLSISNTNINNNNNTLVDSDNFNNIPNNVNVFQILCQSLNHVIRCFINYQNLILKGDLPYDKLIVMAHNISNLL